MRNRPFIHTHSLILAFYVCFTGMVSKRTHTHNYYYTILIMFFGQLLPSATWKGGGRKTTSLSPFFLLSFSPFFGRRGRKRRERREREKSFSLFHSFHSQVSGFASPSTLPIYLSLSFFPRSMPHPLLVFCERRRKKGREKARREREGRERKKTRRERERGALCFQTSASHTLTHKNTLMHSWHMRESGLAAGRCRSIFPFHSAHGPSRGPTKMQARSAVYDVYTRRPI